MAIRQISLTDFRNLKSSTLEFHDRFNVIIGRNASGKTNLLDAIHIVCQGKSFITRHLDQCIQHHKNSFLIFAKYDSYKAGISRSSGKTAIRIDNQTVKKLSHLAEKTPIRIINTQSFNLVLGQPGYKREFLDWCLFHVEHDYKKIWMGFSHALKQRNALLKNKQDVNQLDHWDKYISQFCLLIRDYRESCTTEILKIIRNDLRVMIEDLELECVYEAGWNTEQNLLSLYQQTRFKDLKYGYTRLGVHRDDIKIYTKKNLVQLELSRGQLKRLSITLIIAQVLFVKKVTDKNVVLLIDDINAEMDRESVNIILKILSDYQIQIILTSIDDNKQLLNLYKEYKMFHVEHGMIKAVKTPG